MADDIPAAFRAVLVELLAWDEATAADRSSDLRMLTDALVNGAQRDFLAWVGNSLVKAETVVFCYFSFPHLTVGALQDRKVVLNSDTLWAGKCEELLRRAPALLALLTPSQGSKLALIRALFAAIAMHLGVDKAGASMARVVFRKQTQMYELLGWMTPNQVLRQFCPSHQVTQQADGQWELARFILDCYSGEEHLEMDLESHNPGPQVTDTDLRRLAIHAVFENVLKDKERLRVESKIGEGGEEVEVAIRDDSDVARAVVRGSVGDLSRLGQDVVQEYMRYRGLDLWDARTKKDRREKSLTKKKEREARELTATELLAKKGELGRKLKDVLRTFQGLVPSDEPIPEDGYISMARVVEYLQQRFGERYAPFVPDDLRDYLERHDPLQRFRSETRADGQYLRAAYKPEPPNACKGTNSGPADAFALVAPTLERCQPEGTPVDLRAVVSAVGRDRVLTFEARTDGVTTVLGTLPLESHYFDASGLDSEFHLCDHHLTNLVPENGHFSKSRADWGKLEKLGECGLYFNFVFLPPAVYKKEELYEANPPDGVLPISSHGNHVQVKVDMHRMLQDGWRFRSSIRPESPMLLLRPLDNLHKVDPVTKRIMVPLLQYVKEIQHESVWVGYEPPESPAVVSGDQSAEASKESAVTPTPVPVEEDTFRLDEEMRAIEEYANSRSPDPLRVRLPALMRDQRATQVSALRQYAREHNLEVEDSPDHLFLIATRRSPPLEDLKKLLGIEDFHDDPRLQSAVRHRSMNQTAAPRPAAGARFQGAGNTDYERQEFLGDAIMDICLAHDMYRHWLRRKGEVSASDLHQKFSPTVKNHTLFQRMRDIGLTQFVQSATQLNNEEHEKIYADVFEALIGGLYLGKGLAYAHDKFRRWMAHPVEEPDANFYAWPTWLEARPSVEVFKTMVLMPEDDFHKPRRYHASDKVWTIDSILVATEFPKMTQKDYKTAYSTHFKFADKFSSYRRSYNPEALYDRILLAFQAVCVGYTNETITNKTRFCIDVDGVSIRGPLVPGCTIEEFLQTSMRQIFPALDTYCLVLDCSKPPKKYSQHMHWPNVFLDRKVAQRCVRYLQLLAVARCLRDRFRTLGLDLDPNNLPQLATATDHQPQDLGGQLALRWRSYRLKLAAPHTDSCQAIRIDYSAKSICCELLRLVGVDPAVAITEAGGLFQVSAMVGTTELTISATDKNLAALPELPKAVEGGLNEDDIKLFIPLLELVWMYYDGEEGRQRFSKLDFRQQQELFFIWTVHLDFSWTKSLDMGVFKSRKLRMYMADKFDKKTELSAGRPVTQARIVPMHPLCEAEHQTEWTHQPTPAWKQCHPDDPFIHDTENPAPLTHRSCLRLSSLRNPAHWQENPIVQRDQTATCAMYCDQSYARFAWQSMDPYRAMAITNLTEEEPAPPPSTVPAGDDGSGDSQEEDTGSGERIDALQELTKIDRINPMEWVQYGEGGLQVLELWVVGFDYPLARVSASGSKGLKARGAEAALWILRPATARRLGNQSTAPKPLGAPQPVPSTTAARIGKTAPLKLTAPPSVPRTIAPLVEVSPDTERVVDALRPETPRLLFIPRGLARLQFLAELSKRLRVCWIFDDSEEAVFPGAKTTYPGTLQNDLYRYLRSAQATLPKDPDPFAWLTKSPDGNFTTLILTDAQINGLRPPASFVGSDHQVIVFEDCRSRATRGTCANCVSASLRCLVLSDQEPPATLETAVDCYAFCQPPHLVHPVDLPFEAFSRSALWLPPGFDHHHTDFVRKAEDLLTELELQGQALKEGRGLLDPDQVARGVALFRGDGTRSGSTGFRDRLQEWGESPSSGLLWSVARLAAEIGLSVHSGTKTWSRVKDAVATPVLQEFPALLQSVRGQLRELDRYAVAFATWPKMEFNVSSIVTITVLDILSLEPTARLGVVVSREQLETMAPMARGGVPQLFTGFQFTGHLRNEVDLGKKGQPKQVLCFTPALARWMRPGFHTVIVAGVPLIDGSQPAKKLRQELAQDLVALCGPRGTHGTRLLFLCSSPEEHWAAQEMWLSYLHARELHR